MTTPPYSYVTYTVTAPMVATPQFSYASIGLLPDDVVDKSVQLKVYRNGVLLTYLTQYTFISGSKIDISVTLAVNDRIQIVRDTQKAQRYVDYTNNNSLTQTQLDTDSLQHFYISQQAYDKALSSMVKDDTNTYWQATNAEIKNVGPATDGSSAINYNQLQAYVTGGTIAQIDDFKVYGFDGGGNTDFALPTSLQSITNKQIIVTIDGQLAQPADDGTGTNNSPGAATGYTVVLVGGVPTVRFADPIPAGASVSMRVVKGTISAAFQSGSVTTDMLADASITEQKLVFSTGSGYRVVAVATDGTATAATISATDITNMQSVITDRPLTDFDPPASDLSMGSNKLTNLASGTSATDAVTKAQLDAAFATATTVATYTPATSSLIYNVGWTYSPSSAKPFDILELDFYVLYNGAKFFPDLPTTISNTSGVVNGINKMILGTDTNATYRFSVATTLSTVDYQVSVTRNATGFTITRLVPTTALAGGAALVCRAKYTTLT